MKRFLVVLIVVSGVYSGMLATVGEFPKDTIDRLSRVGAWGSLGMVYGGGTLAIQKLVELAVVRLFSSFSFFEPLQNSYVPTLVGGVVAAPLACATFTMYRDPAWYFFFVLYSGRRASPGIARAALDSLAHYVSHLTMLKDIHRDLAVLLKNAEQAVADQQQPREARDITSELIHLVEQAVANGEKYVISVQQKLDELGFFPEQNLEDEERFPVSPKFKNLHDSIVNMDFREELPILLGGPIVLEIDLTALDRLVRDLIDYWNAYLGGLVDTIDYQVVLCQKVYSMEQFIAGILRRPLAAHPEKPSNPSPAPKPALFI